MFQLKRAYEPASPEDGRRVLVERLWPRGISKAQAAIDAWMKEIAPSAELRIWYGHDPDRWEEFRRRYWAELRARPDMIEELRRTERKGVVTLVYATHDVDHSGALALKQFLARGTPRPRAAAHRRQATRASDSHRRRPATAKRSSSAGVRQAFQVGDHVEWNSEAGRVRGTILKKITAEIQFKGYTVHATREQPQYLIKSDKTDHLAMHKGSALKKLRPRKTPPRRHKKGASS